MWAFVGGTSLRFLFNLPRFSEDLDFSATKEVTELDFITVMKAVKSNFQKELYDVSINAKPNNVVQSAFIKFSGLLYELELSPHESETISIKIEVDTKAPKGWECENSLVRRHAMLNLNHYTKPSLLAGIVHALLCRRYTKGRDYYDLMWYLAEPSNCQPNFVQLNNALAQTDWKGPMLTTSNWRDALAESIQKVNFLKVIKDVDPFLEKKEESQMITKENLLKLLKVPKL